MNKLLFISTLILIFAVTACKFSDQKSNTDSDQQKEKKELVRKLLIEDYDFAVLDSNNKPIPYNKAIYHRGDEVFMVLKNVGRFARGKDSLNHAEMKVEIFDAIGQRISIRENLFGPDGHSDFNDNILRKPYGSYETNLDDKIGKHSFKVTIYDLVSGDSTSVSDDFFIE
ncbi:MAG: hypothetical protein DRJ10_00745 [Bacteroidetes bacterium]|nr:MAG: hypothetical protein DRJ10_00745 [Bacteroidota bacterium]RLD85951.1 MAG: hypothetical protein DRJ07_01955 [Bacteroidota bacterium]